MRGLSLPAGVGALAMAVVATAVAQTAPPTAVMPPVPEAPPGLEAAPPGEASPAASASVAEPPPSAPPAVASAPPPAPPYPYPYAAAPPPPGYYYYPYPSAPVAPPPPAGPDPGDYRHDGFFLRVGAGSGYGHFGVEGDFGDAGQHDASARGALLDIDVAVGGSPTPGLVLGGTFVLTGLPGPRFAADGTDYPGYSGNASVLVLGVFSDLYPSADGGLNFHALLGLASTTFTYRASGILSQDKSAMGFALGAGGGYELWVSPRWSLGLQARLLYANASSSDVDVSYRYWFWAPTLAFVGTMN